MAAYRRFSYTTRSNDRQRVLHILSVYDEEDDSFFYELWEFFPEDFGSGESRGFSDTLEEVLELLDRVVINSEEIEEMIFSWWDAEEWALWPDYLGMYASTDPEHYEEVVRGLRW